MKIDFVSDVACPWCAVGLGALEQALQRIGDAIPVELRFQPYELNPQMPAEGADTVQYLSRKYGIGPERIAHNHALIRERGEQVGFRFGERARVWNTFDAHRLLHWAGLPGQPEGAQRRLKHALLKAYHGEGRNPGAADVLVELAGACALDAGEAAAVVASGRYADEVRAAEAHWQGLGIQAVPSVIVDGEYLIQGGQPSEVFENALREIAAKAAAAPAGDGA